MNTALSSFTALAVLLVGAGVVLFSASDGPGLEARLFTKQIEALCVELNDQPSVSGTLIANDILPGESAAAQLLVSHCDESPPDLLDLDIDFRLVETDQPPVAQPRFASLLIFRSLHYGSDNLLAFDRGLKDDRNLVMEVDQSSPYGNKDGLLSLHEMQAGMNDLVTPSSNGTPFNLTLDFLPQAGNQYQGDRVDITIVFVLSDEAHGDLN